MYDVGEQDGAHFIAMEYVEGENLRQLVARGPLDVDRIVDIGVQMASALEEAHGRGVVHRDIKSANAVATPKGQVKVLDFGLARQAREERSLDDSERVTESRTEVGVVMGTVPYMSPEQALGNDVDARSDLFSLGVVLYELTTGRLPFAGKTATQTIDAICHAIPAPLGESRKDAPPELERIVRKSLEKERDRRYSSARDLGVDLRNLQRDRASGAMPMGSRPRPGKGPLIVLGVAGLVVALAVGAMVEFRRGLALNPGSRSVHEEYGNFLNAMGRLDEGLAQSREAERLDPLSVGPVHDIAVNFLERGDLERAAAHFRRTTQIDPDWTWGYVKLARTLALQKKCPESLAQAESAEARIAGGAAPLSRSWLGAAYATCAETARARKKLDELHALEKTQYVDPVTFAAVHGALGEMDEALRWYEKAFDDRTPNMVYASIAPRFSHELAGNSRYEAIVRRMGFPRGADGPRAARVHAPLKGSRPSLVA